MLTSMATDGPPSFWSGPTPWWATASVAVLSIGVSLLVMWLNNRAARARDRDKLRADDQRRDRQTAATVQAAADNFTTALRQYYETWVASAQDQTPVDDEMVKAARARAQTAAGALHTALLTAQVVLSSEELLASGARLDMEAQELLRKISLYEQGLAFRIPGPGSTDLLFAGFNEKLGLYLGEARRVLHDR